MNNVNTQLINNLKELEKLAAQRMAMVDRQCTLLDKLLNKLLRR